MPGRMTQFDDQRVVSKALQDRGEIRDGFGGAVEGKRELQKDGAEFFCVSQDIKARADSAFVFSTGGGIVREPLPELGGEQERRVGRDAVDPGRGVVGAERLVERSIDFDGVEESGEVLGFVKAF